MSKHTPFTERVFRWLPSLGLFLCAAACVLLTLLAFSSLSRLAVTMVVAATVASLLAYGRISRWQAGYSLVGYLMLLLAWGLFMPGVAALLLLTPLGIGLVSRRYAYALLILYAGALAGMGMTFTIILWLPRALLAVPTICCLLIAVGYAVRHIRTTPPSAPRRCKTRSAALALVAILMLGAVLQVFHEPIADTVARSCPVGWSEALMRLGVFPATEVENALLRRTPDALKPHLLATMLTQRHDHWRGWRDERVQKGIALLCTFAEETSPEQEPILREAMAFYVDEGFFGERDAVFRTMAAHRYAQDSSGASRPDGRCLQALLRCGVSPEMRDSEGNSLLIKAVSQHTVLNSRLLLEAGADANSPDKEGAPPLVRAVRENQPEIIRLLLASGADAQYRDAQGRTLLHLAAIQNAPDSVPPLLEAKVPLQARDGLGATPLHYAAFLTGETACTALRARGVDKTADSLLSLCSTEPVRHPSLKTLCQKLVSNYWKAVTGRQEERRRLLEILMQAGADPFAEDAQRLTPLHYARAVPCNWK